MKLKNCHIHLGSAKLTASPKNKQSSGPSVGSLPVGDLSEVARLLSEIYRQIRLDQKIPGSATIEEALFTDINEAGIMIADFALTLGTDTQVDTKGHATLLDRVLQVLDAIEEHRPIEANQRRALALARFGSEEHEQEALKCFNIAIKQADTKHILSYIRFLLNAKTIDANINYISGLLQQLALNDKTSLNQTLFQQANAICRYLNDAEPQAGNYATLLALDGPLNPIALYLVALGTFKGRGVNANNDNAIALLKRSAAIGHADAHAALAIISMIETAPRRMAQAMGIPYVQSNSQKTHEDFFASVRLLNRAKSVGSYLAIKCEALLDAGAPMPALADLWSLMALRYQYALNTNDPNHNKIHWYREIEELIFKTPEAMKDAWRNEDLLSGLANRMAANELIKSIDEDDESTILSSITSALKTSRYCVGCYYYLASSDLYEHRQLELAKLAVAASQLQFPRGELYKQGEGNNTTLIIAASSYKLLYQIYCDQYLIPQAYAVATQYIDIFSDDPVQLRLDVAALGVLTDDIRRLRLLIDIPSTAGTGLRYYEALLLYLRHGDGRQAYRAIDAAVEENPYILYDLIGMTVPNRRDLEGEERQLAQQALEFASHCKRLLRAIPQGPAWLRLLTQKAPPRA